MLCFDIKLNKIYQHKNILVSNMLIKNINKIKEKLVFGKNLFGF